MKNYLKELAKSLSNNGSKEMTREQILSALINDITIDIIEKTRKRCYSLSVDITPMNLDYVDDIKKYFEERDFKVSLITEGVIFLSWAPVELYHGDKRVVRA